jgi:hypothetical protein
MDSQPGPRRRVVITPVTTERGRGPKMGRPGLILLGLLLLVGILLTLCGPPPRQSQDTRVPTPAGGQVPESPR